MHSELKPCPFCGGTPRLLKGGPGNNFVRCDDCSAGSDDGSEERAIAAWNRRASPSVVREIGEPATPANPAQGVSEAASSIAAMVADWYGSLALPKAHIPASVIEKRLSRFTAAIGAGGQAMDSCLSPAPVQEAVTGEPMLTAEQEAEIVADINSGRWPYLQPSSGDGPPLYTSLAPQAPAAPPAPVPAVTEAIEKRAWECDKWPLWLHSIVDRTNEAADRLDMSSEQAHAYAVLSALAAPPSPSGVVDALRDLANEARSACDARKFPSLTVALTEAALALAAVEGQAGWRLVPEYAIDWLMGEGPDADGVWFDDARMLPGNVARGAFWWRKSFRAMLSVSPKQETE